MEGRSVRHNEEGRATPQPKRMRTEVPAWMTALERMGEDKRSVRRTTATSVDDEPQQSIPVDAGTDEDDEEMALSAEHMFWG
eukprot:6045537-Amphidinium_carterae.1